MSERRRLGRRAVETRRLGRRRLDLKLWPAAQRKQRESSLQIKTAYIILNQSDTPLLLFLIFHHRRTVWLINVYKKTLRSSEMCLTASVIIMGNLFHIVRAVYITDVHCVYSQYVNQQEVLHRPEVGNSSQDTFNTRFSFKKKKGFYSQAGGKKLPK